MFRNEFVCDLCCDLRQSCVASKHLDGLLLRALHDPSLSQQAAALHQRKLLAENAVTTNATRGTAMKTVDSSLRDNSTVRYGMVWYSRV